MISTLSNAQIVLPTEVILGTVGMTSGLISECDAGASRIADAVDCEGDYLLPGLIDLHTDNIEHHFFPRPAVRWPSALTAVLAHDWQILGAGITTVLDALSLGDYESAGARAAILRVAIEMLDRANTSGLMRADHYFHFRCELSDPALMAIVEPHLDHPRLRLVSLMDHTPGQRQWRDLAIFREYRRKQKGQVWTDAEFAAYVLHCRNVQATHAPALRERIRQAGSRRGLPIASHDDTTVEDVEQSYGDGVILCEFPTTVGAARQARERGMKIVMGAPNIVLGGSHSGNVGAGVLAAEGLLDILASDYVPTSLLHSVFLLAQRGTPLPAAVATVTANPAEVLGFSDRGRIGIGMRADLLRVRLVDGVPVIRGIWVEGRQLL
jgi:alpha-D-ribose 1-methylphosphonate 5-triphosphate diphosphatase